MVSDDSLETLYQVIHNLKYFGHYSIFEIEEMIPFERDIYLSMLKETLKEYGKNKG